MVVVVSHSPRLARRYVVVVAERPTPPLGIPLRRPGVRRRPTHRGHVWQRSLRQPRKELELLELPPCRLLAGALPIARP